MANRAEGEDKNIISPDKKIEVGVCTLDKDYNISSIRVETHDYDAVLKLFPQLEDSLTRGETP